MEHVLKSHTFPNNQNHSSATTLFDWTFDIPDNKRASFVLSGRKEDLRVLPGFVFSICTFKLYSICMLRHLERIWLYVCEVYYVHLPARVPVNHTPSSTNMCLTSQIQKRTQVVSTWSTAVLLSQCEKSPTDIQDKIRTDLIFSARIVIARDNRVTDSRSACLPCAGQITLTSRKWCVICGTWSKVRSWARLATGINPRPQRTVEKEKQEG